MSGFSNTVEAQILDHFFGKATMAQPSIFVALSTADPTDDGSGVAEPVGNGYARVSAGAAAWNAATGTAPAIAANGQPVTFAQATGSWGTLTHFALFDASTGGTFLGSGALNTPTAIGNGDTAEFSAGSLQMKLGDPGDTY